MIRVSARTSVGSKCWPQDEQLYVVLCKIFGLVHATLSQAVWQVVQTSKRWDFDISSRDPGGVTVSWNNEELTMTMIGQTIGNDPPSGAEPWLPLEVRPWVEDLGRFGVAAVADWVSLI